MLTETELLREAATSGFRADVLEKAIRLMELLEALRSHPYLKTRVALKGGTALNLFVFDVPRLSVDVDLNYVGAAEVDAMVQERPKVEQAIQAVCGRLGIGVRRIPSGHAGGKWRLSYTGVRGPGTLELDVNFLLRTPLWPTALEDSRSLGKYAATHVPVLDLHELAAGKLAALFGRQASRDVFDARELLRREGLDRRRLRLGFVVYGGCNRQDWRTLSVDMAGTSPKEVDRQLVPMLRGGLAPGRTELEAWTLRLVDECRNLLGAVLPLEDDEIAFLTRLNNGGEIVPQLLTEDSTEQRIIAAHPGLLWKALNVRKHLGLPTDGQGHQTSR
ncbi:MAG TPA: nucleotidyl transferase AbiEii/AbiGii toxin family protein [Longimicrobiales bacterium]|nr:nucleotidyl transferase AbiEii/AbiGii toxin family protein [Longimicrobiales bacterium]